MFGRSVWKKQMVASLRDLETQMGELKKNNLELRMQNGRLFQIIKNMGKKLVTRLPISIESLDKGLDYDLIFSEELETWRTSVPNGVVLDTRSVADHLKAAIPGTYNIPFEQLSVRSESLSKGAPILLVCENGVKSVAACELLESKGYSFLYVLKGGMSLYRGRLVSGQGEPTSESLRTAVTAI